MLDDKGFGPRTRTWLIAAAGLIATWTNSSLAAPPRLPWAEPEAVGMRREQLPRIDAVVQRGLDDGEMCGCVVAVGHRGRLVWLKAYGDRQVEPTVEPMAVDSVFDLASLTKPVATATSVMLLIERGQLRLDGRISADLPEFAQNGKERLTVSQLLLHQGGLIADNPLADYLDGPETAWQRIHALAPVVAAGERFLYSDVGFIVLGKLVEQVSGMSLDKFTRTQLFQPLGMSDTGYLPDEQLCQRAVATQQRDGKWLKGQVHDPRAHQLGGVAGHAGLFSTAEDLAVYAQMMLRGGAYHEARVLSPRSVKVMTGDQPVSSGVRALGWDKRTGYSTNRGDLLTDSAYGHGGFTGTTLWIDPQLDLFVIFLSSRLHPDGKGLVNPLAGRIANIAAAACGARPLADAGTK